MNIEYEWMCYWIVIQIRLEDFFLFIWFLNRRFFQKENICHWWWTCLLIFSQFYFHLPGPNGLSCFRSRSPSVWLTILKMQQNIYLKPCQRIMLSKIIFNSFHLERVKKRLIDSILQWIRTENFFWFMPQMPPVSSKLSRISVFTKNSWSRYVNFKYWFPCHHLSSLVVKQLSICLKCSFWMIAHASLVDFA